MKGRKASMSNLQEESDVQFIDGADHTSESPARLPPRPKPNILSNELTRDPHNYDKSLYIALTKISKDLAQC